MMNSLSFFALIISIVIFNIVEAQKCYAPSGDYCCVGNIAKMACPKVLIVLFGTRCYLWMGNQEDMKYPI